MRKPILIATCLAALFATYYFLYPPRILERKTAKTLTDFATVIESQDRAKIAEALQGLLADTAQIHLEVQFFSITQLDGGKPVIQEFDKANFLTFIDNILFTVNDYHFEPSLDSFSASGDRKSAKITLSSKEWADGDSVYGGNSVKMRFSADTTCDGQVIFDNQHPTFEQLNCKVFLRSIPKASEYKKMQNPEAMGQFLR